MNVNQMYMANEYRTDFKRHNTILQNKFHSRVERMEFWRENTTSKHLNCVSIKTVATLCLVCEMEMYAANKNTHTKYTFIYMYTIHKCQHFLNDEK